LVITPAKLLTAVDLAATAVFALEGAAAGVIAGLDVFGMLVIAFCTALVGGIARDLLLGDTPPAALRSIVYPVVAFAGGAVVFISYQVVNSIPSWLLTGLDAAGLSLFAVLGARKALDHRLNGLAAALLGTVAAVGGGVVRDVLLNRVPIVLTAHVYAVAALAGAAVVVIGQKLGWARTAGLAAGAAACFALRIVSVTQHWNLPRVHT
jgi:uncharacterized membrane protein YeiH